MHKTSSRIDDSLVEKTTDERRLVMDYGFLEDYERGTGQTEQVTCISYYGSSQTRQNKHLIIPLFHHGTKVSITAKITKHLH
jgi:hypothetical protein